VSGEIVTSLLGGWNGEELPGSENIWRTASRFVPAIADPKIGRLLYVVTVHPLKGVPTTGDLRARFQLVTATTGRETQGAAGDFAWVTAGAPGTIDPTTQGTNNPGGAVEAVISANPADNVAYSKGGEIIYFPALLPDGDWPAPLCTFAQGDQERQFLASIRNVPHKLQMKCSFGGGTTPKARVSFEVHPLPV
jgi:hypothetical protein